MTIWRKTHITKQRAQFKQWLSANGAEVLEPTNEWELVRFNSGDGTGVVYFNAAGGVTFTGPAGEAWEAFKSAKSWRARPATKRTQNGTPVTKTIRARDGDGCFYCLLNVPLGDESVEHLVPITHGGPNHISNKFLAHKVCNARAGNLSAVEKIKLHVAAHMKKLECVA